MRPARLLDTPWGVPPLPKTDIREREQVNLARELLFLILFLDRITKDYKIILEFVLRRIELTIKVFLLLIIRSQSLAGYERGMQCRPYGARLRARWFPSLPHH